MTIEQIKQALETQPEVDLGQIPQGLWDQYQMQSEEAEGLEDLARYVAVMMGKNAKALRESARAMAGYFGLPVSAVMDAAGLQLGIVPDENGGAGHMVAALRTPRPLGEPAAEGDGVTGDEEDGAPE